MHKLNITYCTECDYLPLATALAEKIKDKFGLKAELTEGHDGIYAISLNEQTLYNNLEQGGMLPSDAQVFQAIRQAISPAKTSPKLTVYNPMGYPPAITPLQMAPRLDTLDGKTIYLVDARFDDSDRFLLQMQAWFKEHLPNTHTKFVRKAGVYTEDDPALFAEIQAQGHAMIMGVGH